MKKDIKGYTLFEMLVVIAIIGLLSTLAIVILHNARETARNAKRLSDVRQVQTALGLYFSDSKDYPATVDFGGTGSIVGASVTYMAQVPQNPTPVDFSEFDCTGYAQYVYTHDTANGESYHIVYCISQAVSDVVAGIHCVTPDSVADDGGPDCL